MSTVFVWIFVCSILNFDDIQPIGIGINLMTEQQIPLFIVQTHFGVLCLMLSCLKFRHEGESDKIEFYTVLTWGWRLLKTLDTIGNCQRPVFSLNVSQHMHKITNQWKFEVNWSSKLRDNIEKKIPLSHVLVCFQMLDFENSKPNSEVTKSKAWKITAFSKNYVTSEGAASHNVLYYQTLPITRHQEGFYANNYFE